MTRRLTQLFIAATMCAASAACAGRLPPLPEEAAPRYPEFVFPVVPAALTADATTALRHQRGWRFLQAGDLRNANREFSAAVKRNARFFPADAGLGYVSIAEKDYKNALARFDLALRQSANYAPALVGRGDALLAQSKTAEALQAFQAALAGDPSLTIAAQRVQVLQLRVLQAELVEARRAADAGRFDDARRAYQRAIAASPESAFLYRDLGAVERRKGDNKAALEAMRRAVAMDPTDARSLVQIAEILEAQGDFDGAMQAYTQAAAVEPSEAIAAQLQRVRERAAMARMPAEFGQIGGSPRLTRGDLAALLGVHFANLLDAQRGRPTPVITDARGHWAAPWILPVARAGLMEVNPNYTFQPRSPVRRLDLARAISRALNLAAASRPALAARWQAAGRQGSAPRIVDVPVGHLNYASVAQVVAAGIMPLFGDGAFRPADIVTGKEALQVIDRVETLLGRSAGLPPGARIP